MKINFRKIEQFNLNFKFSNQVFFCLLRCYSMLRADVVAMAGMHSLHFLGGNWTFRWEISTECVQLCNNFVEFACISGRQSFHCRWTSIFHFFRSNAAQFSPDRKSQTFKISIFRVAIGQQQFPSSKNFIHNFVVSKKFLQSEEIKKIVICNLWNMPKFSKNSNRLSLDP